MMEASDLQENQLQEWGGGLHWPVLSVSEGAKIETSTRRYHTRPPSSYRPPSSIHHMDRGHRRSDGCVITPIDTGHSNRRTFDHSIDDKLTVPGSELRARLMISPTILRLTRPAIFRLPKASAAGSLLISTAFPRRCGPAAAPWRAG